MSVEQADRTNSAAGTGTGATAKLYTIPGSHACRTAMLALEHKGVAFDEVEIPTGLHPLAVKLLGFPGNPGRVRDVDGRSYLVVGVIDRLGTVPALRYGEQRVQTNLKIIDFLEQLRPDPPLYPSDPGACSKVLEAARWGDEPLQMTARRLALAAGVRGKLHAGGGAGRLGALLAHNALSRTMAINVAGRLTFKAPRAELGLLGELPAMLDRVDAWVGEGVLNGPQLNAADLVVAPCLALLDYRLDLREDLRARPSFALVERLLPEPGASAADPSAA